MRLLAVRGALLAGIWSAGSCSSPTESGPPTGSDPPVALVVVSAPITQLHIGETLLLQVRVEDADGNPLTDRAVTWSTSNPTAMSVSDSGRVRALAAGTGQIAARSEGKADSVVVTVTPHPCDIELPIAIGDTVTGMLQSGDCQSHPGDGSSLDFFRFTLDAETAVWIEMSSTAFDTWLWLMDANGIVITSNDDVGIGSNSAIRITLPAGAYLIAPSSRFAGETGSYTLSLDVDPNAPMCAVSTPLVIGDTLPGTLATTDCVIFNGFYTDRWEITIPDQGLYDIHVVGDGFLPYLFLTDATGITYAESPAGDEPKASLSAYLNPGAYILWMTSWYGLQTGDYEISLRSNPCGTFTSINRGDTLSGQLQANDCRLADSSFAEGFQFTVDTMVAGDRSVRIDLSSPEFDAYLFVSSSNGNVVATDDDGGPGTDARIETTLTHGRYRIWAGGYAPDDTGAYQLTLNVLPSATPNLVVDNAYLVQSIQRYKGTVPLVQGQPGYVRVFGRANLTNTSTPMVRLRLYDRGTLVDSIPIPAASSSVPTRVDEGVQNVSWNAPVPAALIRPGLSITAEIDPDNLVVESDETDNVWPIDGPRAVDVRAVAPFNITFVPVLQNPNGLLGDVHAGNVSTYTELMRRMFPFDSISTLIRATYRTDVTIESDGSGFGDVLAELDALRSAENASRTHVGVVKVPHGYSGMQGLARLGIGTAAMTDFAGGRGRLTAHEVGHTLGRYHSPCGVAGGDQNYPYPDGNIGVFGYDAAAQTVVSNERPDIMSYCSPPWISDYTFEGILNFRAQAAPPPSEAQPVLLVWGTVDGGIAKLEPAFHIVARPRLPSGSGTWRLVLRDAAGDVIASHRFNPKEIPDAPRPAAGFTFALPMDSATVERVASIEVVGPAGRAERRPTNTAGPADRSGDLATARGSESVAVTWVTGKFPMAMVRDAMTGEILSFARHGRFTAPIGSRSVEVLLSDGVKSRRWVIQP